MITNQNSSVQYTGSGSTGPFAVLFNVPDSTKLLVQQITIATGAVSTLDSSQYSYTGFGTEVGALTLISALSASFKIKISRVLNFDQQLDISNNSDFNADILEGQLDTLVMQIQQLRQVITDAAGNGALAGLSLDGENVRVEKAADGAAITNQATLQDDTELQFPVVAGKHYVVTFDIDMIVTTSGGYNFGFSLPASSTVRGWVVESLDAGATTNKLVSAVGSQRAANVTGGVRFQGRLAIDITVNGTVKFQSAQNSATGGNIVTKKDSRVSWRSK